MQTPRQPRQQRPRAGHVGGQRVRGALRAACVGALCLAARTTAYAAPPGAPSSSASSSSGSGATPSKDSASSLMSAADDITRQVAALRGLEPKRSVAKGVLSREAIGARLKERIAKEYTPEEIRTESRVLKRLGLLPADADYEQTLLDLLMEQVAGFYDPFAHRLYIADWLGVDLQRPALAHEIEHALQDQYFDLKAFTAPIKDDGDKQLARSALLEGDGTAVMLEFVAQQLGLDLTRMPDMVEQLGRQLAMGAESQSPAFSHAPRFLRETLLFPYLSGMSFVLSLRKGHPWKRIDEAFRNPPESTEQVLHVDKYLAQEHPVAIVAAPIEALAPAKELRHDVLGELEWRVLLGSKLADATANRAAAGWGGDRLVAYGAAEANGSAGDGAVTIAELSAWDTGADAEEVDVALRQLLGKQLKMAEPDASKPALFESGKLAWYVERRDQEVLVLFGAPVDKVAAVVDEVWAKWKVGPARTGGKAAAPRSKEKDTPR